LSAGAGSFQVGEWPPWVIFCQSAFKSGVLKPDIRSKAKLDQCGTVRLQRTSTIGQTQYLPGQIFVSLGRVEPRRAQKSRAADNLHSADRFVRHSQSFVGIVNVFGF
jgi:hypothetical protein